MLSQRTIGFLIIGLVISVLIVTISSMALYEANNNSSDSYKKSTQVVGGISLTAALSVLIASPIVAGLRGQTLGFFLIAVVLSAFVVTVSSMAIHESLTTTSSGYKDIVRGTSGTALAAAIIGIISVFAIAYKMNSDDKS